MHKPWTLSISIAVGVFIISAAISWLGVRNRLDSTSPHMQFTVISDPVEVAVIAKNNFLNIVILHLKNPNLINKGKFRLLILGPNGTEVRRVEFTGYNVGDPSDLRFQFDPISESLGKEFIFRVEAVSKEGDLISASTGKDGNLAFSAYYKTVSRTQALKVLIGTWGNIMENDLIFFVNWVLFLGITVYLGSKKGVNS